MVHKTGAVERERNLALAAKLENLQVGMINRYPASRPYMGQKVYRVAR